MIKSLTQPQKTMVKMVRYLFFVVNLFSFFFAASALHLLIKYSKINFLVTGAEPFRGDIISTTQYGLDVTFHQDSVTIIMISVSSFFSSF